MPGIYSTMGQEIPWHSNTLNVGGGGRTIALQTGMMSFLVRKDGELWELEWAPKMDQGSQRELSEELCPSWELKDK